MAARCEQFVIRPSINAMDSLYAHHTLLRIALGVSTSVFHAYL